MLTRFAYFLHWVACALGALFALVVAEMIYGPAIGPDETKAAVITGLVVFGIVWAFSRGVRWVLAGV